jgi:hypothetical protein
MIPPSLRSTKTEKRYQKYRESGNAKDISKIKGEKLYGLKNLYNDFELDLVYEKSDMLMAKRKGFLGFWEFWLKLGWVYYRNKHDGFDQLLLNFRHKQSQPQIAHVHRCKLYATRKEFKK